MTDDSLFRCAGDIVFDGHPPFPGQFSEVQLKQFSETSNFLQYTKPLTPKCPYFFGQIRAMSAKSKITIGIAGPDIEKDAHPGKWNNTVGYQSDSGRCYSSHSASANMIGEKFRIGDAFGVMVYNFGKQMSSVIFVKNGTPVATRFLYETDHNKFLPTITLENGPIDLIVMWPPAALGVPKFDDKNMLHWMHNRNVQFDLTLNSFVYNRQNVIQDMATIQCPVPMDTKFQHYQIVVLEVNSTGEGPAVGLATCSPIKPTPTCPLLRDYFRWKADGKALKTKVGQRVGMGIHYSPDNRDKPDFDDKAQQLVLCFVTIDVTTVLTRIMIQPEGGFYPLFVLNESCAKVKVDTESYRTVEDLEGFDKLFREGFLEAQKAIMDDTLQKELSVHMFRKTDALTIEIPQKQKFVDLNIPQHCRLRLPADKKGIHTIQFILPISEDQNFYSIEIKKLNEDSVVTMGLAESTYPQKKHVGRVPNSVGYTSRDGCMYYNGCKDGNLMGQSYEEGDTVGLELLNFDKKWPVALFIKNYKPVGTRYFTSLDLRQCLPTISLCGNGYEVVIDVYWQNRIFEGPLFHINDIEHWCLPADAEVDTDNNIVYVKDHTDPLILQCPYPLNIEACHDYFEISLLDSFDQEQLPPGIGLTTPCFQETSASMSSNFRPDFIRFLAEGIAQQAVAKGNRVGWGYIIPEEEWDKDERMVICYLCIERNIAITRVAYEPPGGFFPIIILPQGVNRVKLESIIHIHTHPVTQDIELSLLKHARDIIAMEIEMAEEGKDPLDLKVDKLHLFEVLENVQKENEEAKKPKTDGMASVVLAANAIEKKRKAVKSKSCVIL